MLLFSPAFLWLGIAASILWLLPDVAWDLKKSGFVTIFIIGAWRYGWFLIHIVRAWIYSHRVFPRLRALARQSAVFPRRLFIVVPSYGEEAFISRKVFSALLDEISRLPSAVVLVVAVGSREEAELINTIVELYAKSDNFKVIFQIQSNGKRVAMGHALRAVSREFNDITALHDEMDNDVVFFMDGDTEIEPGALRNTAGFFCLNARLGALTTDEEGIIYESPSRWVEPWFALKFSKRQLMMKSHSLSKRVMTLTGRFSAFRASAVTDEDFIRHMEADHLSHWLFGDFRFLMGDDKSSWFNLLKNGWEMMYVPDVRIRALESRTEPFFKLSRSLMVRWYGNMLRNNGRALALGYRKTGLFIWVCILDQRISMWTSLIGPVSAIMLSLTKSVFVLPFYLSWIIVVRVMQIIMLIPHGHRPTIYDVPLQLYDQWFGSITKIYNLSFISKQRWGKRDSSQHTCEHNNCMPRLQNSLPFIMLSTSVVLFVFSVAMLTGIMKPWLLLLPGPAQAESGKMVRIATRYGIIPDDGKDDAAAIQHLIDSAPVEKTLVILLPQGRLDFTHPLVIRRSNTSIVGKGAGKTHIVARFPPSSATDLAVIELQGRGRYGKKHYLTEALEKGSRVIPEVSGFSTSDWIKLEADNTSAYLADIGSKKWNKRLPRLRQEILPLKSDVTRKTALSVAVGEDYPAGTLLQRVGMVENVMLADFSIKLVIPQANGNAAKGFYANLYPDYLIDLIRLEYAAHSTLENIALSMAGRHPLHLNNSTDNSIRHLSIDGAWNKGKKGTGYVRISRSHRNVISDSSISNIRHLTVQWSSSFNRFERLEMAVDVNFHGGQSHDNQFFCIHHDLPATHPWPAVYRTPDNAPWAPPDGDNNRVVPCT